MFGTRKMMQDTTIRARGTVERNISVRTNFVVLGGDSARRDWSPACLGQQLVEVGSSTEGFGAPKGATVHWAAEAHGSGVRHACADCDPGSAQGASDSRMGALARGSDVLRTPGGEGVGSLSQNALHVLLSRSGTSAAVPGRKHCKGVRCEQLRPQLRDVRPRGSMMRNLVHRRLAGGPSAAGEDGPPAPLFKI